METAIVALIWALFASVIVFTLFGVVHLSARTDRVTQQSLSIQESTRRSQRESPQ